jgi:hypothetical protein
MNSHRTFTLARLCWCIPAFWLFGLPHSLLAQTPPNDQFSNRIVLTGTNVEVSGWNTNATKQKNEPNHAGNAGGASVWWAWTAPTNGDVVITTDGSDFDTLLGVYTGSSILGLSVVASNDDHSVLVTSRVRFQPVAGTQYQIGVDGFNDGTNVDMGNITLSLEFVPDPITRPANDSFTNATVLTGAAVSVSAANVEATHEPGEPLHAGKAGDTSVWWRWIALVSGVVRVTTAGSSFDTLLAVYTGTGLTNMSVIATNDDADPAGGILTSTLFFNAEAGREYRIAVDGFDGAAGQIALEVVTLTPTLNATAIRSDGTFQFTVSGANGVVYQIQASPNLVDWNGLGTVTNLPAVFVDYVTNNTPRFYRARLTGN